MESLQALRPVQRCNSSALPRGFQTFRSGCSLDCYNINQNNRLKFTSVRRFCRSALKDDKDGGHCLFILQEASHSLLLYFFHSAGCQLDTTEPLVRLVLDADPFVSKTCTTAKIPHIFQQGIKFFFLDFFLHNHFTTVIFLSFSFKCTFLNSLRTIICFPLKKIAHRGLFLHNSLQSHW